MTVRSNQNGRPRGSQASPLAPGEVVAGKYRIDEAVGEGGMAIIYSARHLVLDQRVAVKVLIVEGRTDETMTERFLREAQAAARLQSEHASRVMDAGILSGGEPYLVMEFLDGCDLGELLALSGKIEVQELADYVLQALEGIAHAHAAGIVHRDIKPSNLFLTLRPDGSNVIKVVDFGISKSTVEPIGAGSTKLTGKAVLGSPAYMSPEQVRNASDVDHRSDVWSLGVTMYELLTGCMPFDGDGVGAVLAAILETDPVPVHERMPQIPEALSDAVARCLRRNRSERWADAAALARGIAQFGSGKYANYPERIAATLVNSAKLRPPTPLGSFPVASFSALVESAEPGALGVAPPPPPSSAKAFAARNTRDVVANAPTLADTEATTVTHQGRHGAGVARAAALVVALSLGAVGALGMTRSRQVPAVAAPATEATLPSATREATSLPAPTPEPATPIAVTGAPSTSATAALPKPRPPHRLPLATGSAGSSRPAILHSRN